MKPTAYFINVARGELVQQDVLVRGLREGWIRGAALDVFEGTAARRRPADQTRQRDPGAPLAARYPPGASPHAGVRGSGMRRVAAGTIPENVLNPAVLESPAFRAKLDRYADQVRRRHNQEPCDSRRNHSKKIPGISSRPA